MLKVYEGVIEPYEDGYTVSFPDIEGCTTQGVDLKDAYEMGADVLGLALEVIRDKGEAYPSATFGHEAEDGGTVVAFAVNTDDDFSSKFVTVREACDMLGVTSQRIQALIKSGDLESEKIGTIRMVDQQSVIDYRKRSSSAGRPFWSSGILTGNQTEKGEECEGRG